MWLCLIPLVLFTRFVLLRDQGEHMRLYLFYGYILVAWLPCIALNAIKGQKLMSYLQENHNEKWQELTYVPGFGPGGQNGSRVLRFLFSQDDVGDMRVKRLKDEYRGFLKLMMTIFVTWPFISILIIG